MLINEVPMTIHESHFQKKQAPYQPQAGLLGIQYEYTYIYIWDPPGDILLKISLQRNCIKHLLPNMGLQLHFTNILQYIQPHPGTTTGSSIKPLRLTPLWGCIGLTCFYDPMQGKLICLKLVFRTHLRQINLPDMVFRFHFGNYPNEVGKPISGKKQLPNKWPNDRRRVDGLHGQD